MKPEERIIVALDRTRREEILALVERLSGTVGVFKLGLEAFIANGPSIVRDVTSAGGRVFLDLKLHDIPNTVARATAAAGDLGAAMLTLHAAGGSAMIRSAAAIVQRPLILGVTMLTSLGDQDIDEIGFGGNAASNALRLARLAKSSGADGCISSPREIEIIRAECGHSFLIVTPGIRGPNDERGDQRRTMSAADAIRAGADYIVIGRPITEAADPRAAAERIVETLS